MKILQIQKNVVTLQHKRDKYSQGVSRKAK